MKHQEDKPVLPVTEDSGLSLSGADLTGLLLAVVSQGSLLTLQAKGFSMSPFIKDGDAVTLSPLNGGSPGTGNVVAFIHPIIKRIFIHRVIEKKSDSYIIKGDHNLEADGPVPAANILGLVTRVDRNNKRIVLGLGPERLLIAFLSRRNLLLPLLPLVGKMVGIGRFGREFSFKFFNNL